MSRPINLNAALEISGWSTKGELSWLAEKASTSQVVVEVGSFRGRSARAMRDNMTVIQRLILVDPLDPERPGGGLKRIPEGGVVKTRSDGDALYVELCRNILTPDRPSERPLIWILRCDSRRAAQILGEMKADLVFIDGDHSYQAVRSDIAIWRERLTTGGVLCGHDYHKRAQGPEGKKFIPHEGVKRAVDEAFPRDELEFPIGSIWMWNRKGG